MNSVLVFLEVYKHEVTLTVSGILSYRLLFLSAGLNIFLHYFLENLQLFLLQSCKNSYLLKHQCIHCFCSSVLTQIIQCFRLPHIYDSILMFNSRLVCSCLPAT